MPPDARFGIRARKRAGKLEAAHAITTGKFLAPHAVTPLLEANYLPRTINHGVGFNTAAIELLFPTYGLELGLKGKACTHWALNPHPTMIPAVESGFVETISPVGGEVGMEAYVDSKPDIFPVGFDGTMRSNRFFSQMCGHYAADMFIGSTVQIDTQGDSSTVTSGRLVGYGGAPNFGCDARGRR